MEISVIKALRAVRLIVPNRYTDERGVFVETWRDDMMTQAGIAARFVQDNHVLSSKAGTVRGLHFQIGAAAQAKLMRCIRGRVFDVVVDVRHGSPTFGHYVGMELSAENWRQLFVPAGFAHGYCTLEPDTEVQYKVTAYYDRSAERGVAWNDPTIAIDWPVSRDKAVLSPKDSALSTLAEMPEFFPFTSFPD